MRTRFTLLILLLCTFSNPVFAYYETLETGEILEKNHYLVNLSSQAITDNDSGINFTAKMSAGLNEDSGFGAILGVGTTDFVTGGFYKWVPFPDYENQPAIGFTTGIMYARIDGLNELSIRFNPIVSKKYQTDLGPLTPYLSVPTGIRSFNGKTTLPIQFAAGSEYEPNRFEHIRFIGEIGFNISNAFTYVTVGVTFEMDETNGIQLF